MIVFHIDWVQVLGLLIGVILPLLVAVVTKLSTAPWIKAVLLAALSLVTNLLTEVAAALSSHVEFDLGNALLLGLGTFIIAVATALGFWNPTLVTHKLMKHIGPKDPLVVHEQAVGTEPPSAL